MAIQVQLRRGTTAQHSSFTGASAEVTVDTDLNTLRIHDNSTAGGFRLAKTNDLTTANVTEVTNLYYTNARVDARVTSAVSPAFDAANVALINASAAFDSSNTKATSSDLTTANVSEVTNLYFTSARAINALASNTVSIGDLTITGNLFVQGDTVEVNTATLTVEDKNILLANGSVNAAASNGAGITVDGSSANLIYLSTGDKWAFNKSLNVDGEIAATGNVTSPFFYSESDAVLKEDIEPIINPLNKILKLAGVTFTWKKSKQSGLGVIAQEVEKIVPEIVSTNLNGHKTVSYDSLVPILIEAVKEQQKQIEYLKKKIK